jgi:radical SAM-linked protein
MTGKKFPLKIAFLKKDEMIYFSQIDLASVFERALRRSGLPLYYTQGFNPHVKISFSRALKLGVVGQEEATFYFTHKITPQELLKKLACQLPQGLEILQITAL